MALKRARILSFVLNKVIKLRVLSKTGCVLGNFFALNMVGVSNPHRPTNTQILVDYHPLPRPRPRLGDPHIQTLG